MTESEWLASDAPARMLDPLTGYGAADQPATGFVNVRPETLPRKLRLWVAACRSRGRASDFVDDLETAFGLHVAVSYWASRDAESSVPMPLRAALLRDIVGNPFRRLLVTDSWVMNPEAFGFAGVFDKRWLTPTVVSLATAAYEERPGRKCERCDGKKSLVTEESWREFSLRNPRLGPLTGCPDCHATGRIEDGTLDLARLAVLSDALEEAGCPPGVDDYGEIECPECGGAGELYGNYAADDGMEACDRCDGRGLVMGDRFMPNPLLAHLRSPGPHVRGCHALDLTMGKQ